MYEKSLGHACHQFPLFWWNSSGGKQALRRQQLRSPSFGRQEEGIGRKTEPGFACRGTLKFSGKMECVALGNAPPLGKREQGVAGICRRVLLSEGGAVPSGLSGGDAETQPPGQAQF